MRTSDADDDKQLKDINTENISNYLSLTGLKFEKLIRSTPSLQVQLKRMFVAEEISVPMIEGITDTFKEAQVYGFGVLSVKPKNKNVASKQYNEPEDKSEVDEEEELVGQRKIIREAKDLIQEEIEFLNPPPDRKK